MMFWLYSHVIFKKKKWPFTYQKRATQVLLRDYFYYKYTVLKWNGTWHASGLPLTETNKMELECVLQICNQKITNMQHDKQNSRSSQTPRRAF